MKHFTFTDEIILTNSNGVLIFYKTNGSPIEIK